MIKNDYGPGSGRFLEHEHSSSSQHPHKWKVKMILFCWFRKPLEHKYSSSPAPAKMENKNDHRGRRSVMTMLTILLLESHYLLSQWFWEHNLTLLWLGINLSISQKKKLFKIIFSGFLNTNTAPHQHPQMANYGLMDQVGWWRNKCDNCKSHSLSKTKEVYRRGYWVRWWGTKSWLSRRWW